jgi:hypothetical protein
MLGLVGWLCAALAASTLVFQTFVKPRLPMYLLQLESLPRLRWIENQWKTLIPTRVRLFNENYVPIYIYALQFDVFYSALDGSLQHLGQVQDRHQQNLPATTTSGKAVSSSSSTCQMSTSNNNSNHTAAAPTVWQIGPRADFDCQDEIYFSIPSVQILLGSILSLAKQFVTGSGVLILPTTGVAHVQVPGLLSAAARATVSIICDNRITVWKAQVQGLTCRVAAVQPGFTSLESAAHAVREQVLPWRTHAATGGLFLS